MHGEFWAESALMHEWKMWDRKIRDEMSGPEYVGPNTLAQKRRYRKYRTRKCSGRNSTTKCFHFCRVFSPAFSSLDIWSLIFWRVFAAP